MFKRRKPLTKFQHLRELCWPTMGWRRAGRYVYLRIVRMSDSTHKIAAGLATGVAIGCTPVLGTHFIQAALLAWIFRLNILAALIGTFWANPWTIPFIWWGSIELGAKIFSFFGVEAKHTVPDHLDFAMLKELLFHEPVRILLPWLVGGYLIALLSWVPSYGVIYFFVRGAKAARKKVKMHKLHKVAMEVTGQRR